MASEEALHRFAVDALDVSVFADRNALGKAAASAVAAEIARASKAHGDVSMIFAAAPSQDEFLKELSSAGDVEFSRITAFHMDEYIGLPEGAEQRFSSYLRHRLFGRVNFKQIHYLRPREEDPESECARYASLLEAVTPDIVCMGIGENGHIAFNDPGVADFSDPCALKVVELDARCRLQQVHDRCFSRLEEVPARAVTLTIPALMKARFISCVVPGASKAEAVGRTLRGSIDPGCPASILRTHSNAALFLDTDSARLVL
jgi:glucosamine-6-phosphate deaminase